jgi:hypothetical protein
VGAVCSDSIYGLGASKICLRIISSVKAEANAAAAELLSLDSAAWKDWSGDTQWDGNKVKTAVPLLAPWCCQLLHGIPEDMIVRFQLLGTSRGPITTVYEYVSSPGLSM